MPKFRSKLVEVDAFQLTKENRASNGDWPQWMHEAWNGERGLRNSVYPFNEGTGDGPLGVHTEDAGTIRVDFGDFIVRFSDGELIPFTAEEFSDQYEPMAIEISADATEELQAISQQKSLWEDYVVPVPQGLIILKSDGLKAADAERLRCKIERESGCRVTIIGDGVSLVDYSGFDEIRRQSQGDRKLVTMADSKLPRLDGKFHGVVIKNKNNTVVPDDQWCAFLAKDDAFPATLKFYYEECIRRGADSAHLDAVLELADRVRTWRVANPDKCKVPDVEPGEIKT